MVMLSYRDNFINFIRFEKRYSPHTVVSYETDLTQFISFLNEDLEVDDIHIVNYQDVRSWIYYLSENNISASSVNRKITCLRSYFKYLIQENIISENPMFNIISLKKAKKLPVFIQESKMNQLLDNIEFPDSFEGYRDKLIIDVFYMTGIRVSELLSISIKDIDFSNHIMKVIGKRDKERLIPLTLDLTNRINNFCNKHRISDFLFINEKGNKISSKNVYNIVNKYLSMVSSLEKKSPHVLRHTFATHMMNNGADINAIKEILGHSSLNATQIYTHNTIDRIKDVYKKSHPRA